MQFGGGSVAQLVIKFLKYERMAWLIKILA